MSHAGPTAKLRRDIASAYFAAGAKIGSWVVISALLYRDSQTIYALFALLRGTIGLLSYTSLGLGPALISLITKDAPVGASPDNAPPSSSRVLQHQSPLASGALDPARAPYSNAVVVALCGGLAALGLLLLYSSWLDQAHDIPARFSGLAHFMVLRIGAGTLSRLMGDVPGAVIQTKGRIYLDNVLLIVGEAVWVLGTLALWGYGFALVVAAADAYWLSGITIMMSRWWCASRLLRLFVPDTTLVNRADMRSLVVFGGLITFAQLADFLYAPTDYILINRLLDPIDVATYAPAVQIDGALLLLVGALASVLLPRSAVAHAAGNVELVRQYYVHGTLVSLGILAAAAVGVVVLSPWVFRLWLGSEAVGTRAILPLVMIHTVVGGASGVGRSVLLGMGKIKAFSLAAIAGGLLNVALSYVFVRYLGLGLKGIIYGTIVSVTVRCVIWMPWYILRSLRSESAVRATDLPPQVIT